MKFFTTGFFTLSVAIQFVCASSALAQGTLEVSNTGQSTTGNLAVGSDSWIAQGFGILATDQNAYSLNSIQLLMGSGFGSPSGFGVSIYSSSAVNGSPLYDLGNLTGSASPVSPGVYDYTACGIALSSGNYFVVVTASTPVAAGNYLWNAGNSLAGSGTWYINDAYGTSANGLTWASHVRGDVFQMAVYATPIPEPSTCALGAVGALVLGFNRWRNRGG